MLLSEYAIKWRFVISPPLGSVSDYLRKHEPRNLVFLVMLYTENNTDFACYIFLIHQPILIFLAENSCYVWAIISLFNLSCLFAIKSIIGYRITNAEMTHFQRHWLFVNMPFTKKDKILIENLFELKGYNARHLFREFSRKS